MRFICFFRLLGFIFVKFLELSLWFIGFFSRISWCILCSYVAKSFFELSTFRVFVEMGESCGDCTKWTEDIYWTHFHPKHFSQILLNGFDQQLVSLIFILLFAIYQCICKPLTLSKHSWLSDIYRLCMRSAL